uniref:Host cell factor C1 regulator 1 n=1 Tax=Ovis aries TaxID=9940 RepID=A0AC11CRF4_SHEEP
MILQQPLERGPQGRAQRDPRAASGASGGLDAREPLRKQFLSEENMATHFSQLSLHNDHPYCSPPRAFPPALPPLRESSTHRKGPAALLFLQTRPLGTRTSPQQRTQSPEVKGAGTWERRPSPPRRELNKDC